MTADLYRGNRSQVIGCFPFTGRLMLIGFRNSIGYLTRACQHG